LHPKVFGGILNRQDNENDISELESFEIPQIGVVIVDLYPLENTVASGAREQDVIEKIDLGGISLIRAAGKNFKDVACVSSVRDYAPSLNLLTEQKSEFTLEQRKQIATTAFNISSHYDSAIFNYFNKNHELASLKISELKGDVLRYGENPHQKGFFFGDFEAMFNKLHGKELSYNNLLDVDAAVNLMNEFKDEAPTFAILKHNNACGLAQRDTLRQAYLDALAGDPVSAFGGILICNKEIDLTTAEEIHNLFCEVVIAPSYSSEALELLKGKKNRILLIIKNYDMPQTTVRSCLNGVLVQDKDNITDAKEHLTNVTQKIVTQSEIDDLLFASKICKHTKSNTIILV